MKLIQFRCSSKKNFLLLPGGMRSDLTLQLSKMLPVYEALTSCSAYRGIRSKRIYKTNKSIHCKAECEHPTIQHQKDKTWWKLAIRRTPAKGGRRTPLCNTLRPVFHIHLRLAFICSFIARRSPCLYDESGLTFKSSISVSRSGVLMLYYLKWVRLCFLLEQDRLNMQFVVQSHLFKSIDRHCWFGD